MMKNNNKTKKDLFREIFYFHLENAILKSNSIQGVDFTNRELKGYINKLIDVFSTVKIQDGKYHLYASQLTNLKRNKLDAIFNVFERNSESTYHKNNSRIGNNSYTHWYDVEDWFLTIYAHSLSETYNYIKTNEKYERSLNNYRAKIKEIKGNNSKKKKQIISNIDDYIVIEKDKFLKLFDGFTKGQFDYFTKYLNNVIYFNKDFVYVDNDLKNNKIDKYDGLGRRYTVLTSTSKDVRKYILEDYTEIDINSCSIAILCNLWLNDLFYENSKNDLEELKKYYPELHSLITNKKGFVEKYKRILNTTEKKVKNIIVHLTFEPMTYSISNKFTKEELEKFKNDLLTEYEITKPNQGILLGGFIRELRMIRQDVISTYYGGSFTGKGIKNLKINNLDIRDIKNIVDKWFVLDGSEDNKKDSKIIHKIIELVEHQVRKIVLEFIKGQGIENVYQIHDAFIFKGQIDIKSVESHIFDRIGFVVRFSEEKYSKTMK